MHFAAIHKESKTPEDPWSGTVTPEQSRKAEEINKKPAQDITQDLLMKVTYC